VPQSCGFVMPRTVCKREITREEADYYLRTGKTELLTDFTSRFGRPFSATLVLKETGRHGFEFPPRKRAGEEEGPAAEGGEAAASAEPKPAKPAKPAKAPRAKKGRATAATAADKPAAAAKTARKKAPRKKKTTAKKSAAAEE
jgi:DNA topoisomerase-3